MPRANGGDPPVPEEGVPANAPGPQLFTSTLGAGTLGLFFSPDGAAGSSTFAVRALADSGACLADPRIVPGVVLLAVQGIPLAGLAYAEGLSLIRAAGRPIQLTFSRNTADLPLREQTVVWTEAVALAQLQRAGEGRRGLPMVEALRTARDAALYLLSPAGASLAERPLNLDAEINPEVSAVVVFREQQPLAKRRYKSKERPVDVWRVHGGTSV